MILTDHEDSPVTFRAGERAAGLVAAARRLALAACVQGAAVMAEVDDLTIAVGVVETRLRLLLSALVDLRVALAARGTTPQEVLSEMPRSTATVH